MHGAPVHIGDPAEIGIADLARPDFGDAVAILADELPVFWACGVTPQEAIRDARLPLVITHKPGYMLVTDIPNSPPGGVLGRRQRPTARRHTDRDRNS